MKVTKASPSQVSGFIQNNGDWELLEGKLHKEFVFSNFSQAFAFMASIAEYAEATNHHPEWFNVYKKVKVDLTTHEVSGISERDFRMAIEMDSVARQMDYSGGNALRGEHRQGR